MALYDDKRFILSHIRHSFITCDDTGMCETVMLNEHSNRYPPESLYHHPFDYDSDEDYDPYHNYYTDYTDEEEEEEEEEDGEEEEDDEVKGKQHHLNKELHSLKVKGELKNRITQSDLDFFKATEVEYKSELIEENAAQSFDIMSDSYDIMGIRRRSNTAQRLEKLRKERNFQSKTKVITWKSPTKIVEVMDDGTVNRVKRIVLYPGGLSKDELALLHYDEKDNVYYETDEYRKLLFPFIPDEPKSPVDELDGNEAQDQVGALSTASKPPKERRKSVLSMQIERSPNAPVNPFNEYTRFDGRVSEGNAHTKRIRIFFRLFEQDVEFQQADFAAKLASSGIACGANWIEIVVLASGRVSDLIGLICWHYTHLQIGPPLKSDPCMYALKIAEENGDVDNDFPSLTQTDDIKRYGFPYLALVEIETHIVVTILIESEEVFSQIIVNSLTTTLQEIVDQIKKKRAHLFRSIPLQGDLDPQVQLELRTKPGVALDLTTKIGDYLEPSQGGGTSDRHSSHSHIGSVNFSLKLINHANRLSVMRNEGRVRKISAGFLDVTDATGGEEVQSSSVKGKLDTPSMLRANRHSSIALFNLDKEALVSNPSISPGTPGVTLTVPGTPGGQSSGGTLTRGGGKLLRSREPKDWSQNMLDMMEAPLYQCFEVMAVNKLVNSPMEMGISGTKVEITPKTSSARSPNSHFTDRFFSKFNQMKAVNIDVEDVVDCCALPSVKVEILGRQLFKLVYYTGSDFKSLKFEGDGATVEDILFKLANVMKMRTSVRRNEYQAIKSRKKSISTKIYFKPRLMISSSSSDSEDEDGERGGGDGSETSTKEGTGGGGAGSVGAEGGTGNITDALDGSFYGQAAPGGSTVRSTKKDSKFRRFKSKP